MTRRPRLHAPGLIFHAMARGNGGCDVFLDATDCRVFLSMLRELKARQPFTLFAYCLMVNHFHLLLEVGDVALSSLMQQLLTRYACYFNARRERRGHVFQSRFHAIRCSSDRYFLQLVRYIHLNPVACGLVAQADRWRWSSHREYLADDEKGLASASAALSMFADDALQARRAYADFLLEPGGCELPIMPDEPPVERGQPTVSGPGIDLAELLLELCGSHGLSAEDLRSSRSGAAPQARFEFIRRAARAGYRTSDIARALGVGKSAVSNALARVRRLVNS